MARRRAAAVLAVATLALTSGMLSGCAWLSGFDGDDYQVSSAGGAGGAGASVGAGGGFGAAGAGGGTHGGAGGSGAAGAGPSGGSGSGGSGACSGVVAMDESRVFVLRTALSGDFGGVEAGDEICRLAASDCLVGGTWKAYLNDGAMTASARLPDVSPWHKLDGTLAFETHADLSGSPSVLINIDERGDEVSQGRVWTGMRFQDGTASPDHCSEWTSGSVDDQGEVTSINDLWTQSQKLECDEPARLFCFEVGT